MSLSQNGESEASPAGKLAKESQLTKVGSYFISMHMLCNFEYLASPHPSPPQKQMHN